MNKFLRTPARPATENLLYRLHNAAKGLTVSQNTELDDCLESIAKTFENIVDDLYSIKDPIIINNTGKFSNKALSTKRNKIGSEYVVEELLAEEIRQENRGACLFILNQTEKRAPHEEI